MNRLLPWSPAAALLLAVLPVAHAQRTALDVRVDTARQARLSGNVGASVDALTAIVAEAPDNFRAQYNLGLSLAADARNEPALQALKQAELLYGAQAEPDATIYNTLGWQLLQMGQASEAIKYFEKGMALEGHLPANSRSRLLNNYGLALMQSLRYDDAEKMFQRAKTEFNNPLAARNLELIAAIKNEEGRWAVIFGGDESSDAAQDEIRKASGAGVTGGDIVYREGSFRSIAEFSKRSDADAALTRLKSLRTDAYVVRMDSWCPAVNVVDGRKTCEDR